MVQSVDGEAVLAGYLFADPGVSVIGAERPKAAPQLGLFETPPSAAREKALAWQRHAREVECGLADGPGSEGAAREQYDPRTVHAGRAGAGQGRGAFIR